MKQLYFIFVVVLCMATGCGSKKDASGDSDQHIFQIDSVDRVTGVQRMQVSRTNQDIVCNGNDFLLLPIAKLHQLTNPNIKYSQQSFMILGHFTPNSTQK